MREVNEPSGINLNIGEIGKRIGETLSIAMVVAGAAAVYFTANALASKDGGSQDYDARLKLDQERVDTGMTAAQANAALAKIEQAERG